MEPLPLTDELPSRYVVGMDLGTTNSAVAYVDTAESPWQVRIFSVPQLVAPAQVEARETLPSFHFEPAEAETTTGALRLPWSKDHPTYTVGFHARDQGTAAPGRLIASAKSWLCHSGVDRTAPILPWQGLEDVERLSPVEVSARFLRQVREAWDARFPSELLARQDFVLTLPASFDEVARELTIEAAARAGLSRVVLIEEPQAAFYAWVYKHADDWEAHVQPGQKILVCDVGGGTSDFTLIRVRRAAENGTPQRAFPIGEAGAPQRAFPTDSVANHKIQFHRVAVGEHLILGGDNLDLALAHHVEGRLKGDGKLEPRQWDVLVRVCRRVKESLLTEGAPEHYTINLPGSGSRLIGGGLQVEVSRDEVRAALVDGFFPTVSLDDKPVGRRSGFQEFGLPYAADAAVTKYLAAFLSAHRNVALDAVEVAGDHDPARPDVLLFNGGLFASDLLRERIVDSLAGWFRTPREPKWWPLVLDNDRLDLAVARGAAYYGMVRRGEGVKIAAGLARSYYIGVEGVFKSNDNAELSAICLVPGSAEPGQTIDLANRKFELLISQPVEFPLFISSTRLTDLPGDLLPIDREQMRPLPPIRTVLRSRRRGESGVVSVTLHSRLTEIGTIDLWCSEVGGERSWRLQFDVRSATQTDVAAHESAAEEEGVVDEAAWRECAAILAGTFDPSKADKPDGLMKRLATALGQDRHEWPTSLLRRMWEALMELEPGRRKSQAHEARWLNLLGYALRPGYGLAVDDWRVSETWRNVQGKLAFGTPASRTESWILWRRIAGGLSAGQQLAVADPLLAPVRGLHRRTVGGKTGGVEFAYSPAESVEMWRLLGSLELLPVGVKVELGNILLDLAARPKLQPARAAMIWAVGRLGARAPVYGPLNTVPPADVAARWLDAIWRRRDPDATDLLAVMQLARRTDDRYRDLSPTLRGQAVDWLDDQGAPSHFAQLVRDGGRLDAEEQGKVFGDALPRGLRIA